MTPSAAQTARILAEILERSGQARARVSRTTLQLIARRHSLRSTFIIQIIDELSSHGWLLAELDAGGFGAIRIKSLEAAKTVTAKRVLTGGEFLMVKNGKSFQEIFGDKIPQDESDVIDDE